MDRSRDRGLIYALVGILVVILIIAIGVIVFMGMRMIDMQKESNSQKATTVKESKSKVDVQEEIKKAVQEQMSQLKPKESSQKQDGKLAKEDIATIVQLVMSQMDKREKKTPTMNKSALVATDIDSALKEAVDGKESSESAPKKEEKSSSSGSLDDNGGDLESVLDVLRSVDVDKVDEGDDEVNISLDSLDLDSIEAKNEKKKSPDTFNKVIVETNESSGELAKIGNELEQLAKKEAKSVKEKAYEKRMRREIKERRNEMRIIVVRRGDTLSTIAKRAYGSGKAKYYRKILRANPRLIKNPNRIFVGQRLRVPR